MTSFNLLLAKGENLLRYIFDIIVRNRCKQNAWSSDISKLYNQLNLDISALSYSLFLFHDSLDPNVEPEVWVMTRAWYGISSTGGQAGAGIINLITMDQKIKMLYKPWKKIDLLGGDETREGVEKQVQGTTNIFGKGGFSLKFIVHCGAKCDKASSDGETVKMLGYKWTTEPDLLSPGLGELNLNKKIRIRAMKKPKLSLVI